MLDQKGIMDIGLDLYKNPFRRENRINISLGQDFWNPDDLVMDSENELLTAPFQELEVKEQCGAAMQMGLLGLMDLALCFIINLRIILRLI